MENRTVNLFDYPEFTETFDKLFEKLLEESGRGAILIGTSYVEDHLSNYILKILPSNEKKYIARLMNYPGPLSSFSAKVELSYAFRLIPEYMYKSLNALRKIRNDAAHSSKGFSLIENSEKLDEVFNLGQGFKTLVHETSARMMLRVKIEGLKATLRKGGLTDERIVELLKDKLEDKETIDILETQLPHWKLIYGLSLICGFLKLYSDDTTKILEGINIWSQLSKNSEKD